MVLADLTKMICIYFHGKEATRNYNLCKLDDYITLRDAFVYKNKYIRNAPVIG